jgi:hypothetical protein
MDAADRARIGRRRGMTPEERQRLNELEREYRESRRSDEILRKASVHGANRLIPSPALTWFGEPVGAGPRPWSDCLPEPPGASRSQWPQPRLKNSKKLPRDRLGFVTDCDRNPRQDVFQAALPATGCRKPRKRICLRGFDLGRIGADRMSIL